MLLLLEEVSENLFSQQPMTMLGPSNSALNNQNSVHLSDNTGEHGKNVHNFHHSIGRADPTSTFN